MTPVSICISCWKASFVWKVECEHLPPKIPSTTCAEDTITEVLSGSGGFSYFEYKFPKHIESNKFSKEKMELESKLDEKNKEIEKKQEVILKSQDKVDTDWIKIELEPKEQNANHCRESNLNVTLEFAQNELKDSQKQSDSIQATLSARDSEIEIDIQLADLQAKRDCKVADDADWVKIELPKVYDANHCRESKLNVALEFAQNELKGSQKQDQKSDTIQTTLPARNAEFATLYEQLQERVKHINNLKTSEQLSIITQEQLEKLTFENEQLKLQLQAANFDLNKTMMNKMQADSAQKALTEANHQLEELQFSNASLRRELDATRKQIQSDEMLIDFLNIHKNYFRQTINKQEETVLMSKILKLEQDIKDYKFNIERVKDIGIILRSKFISCDELITRDDTRATMFIDDIIPEEYIALRDECKDLINALIMPCTTMES